MTDPIAEALLTREQPGLKPGYAGFNGYPHLCVEVPDGGFTISAKTSGGELITFSFVPYKTGGPPRCVDVHTVFDGQGDASAAGRPDLKQQHIIVFGPGQDRFNTRKLPEDKPATLATFLLHKPKE